MTPKRGVPTVSAITPLLWRTEHALTLSSSWRLFCYASEWLLPRLVARRSDGVEEQGAEEAFMGLCQERILTSVLEAGSPV